MSPYISLKLIDKLKWTFPFLCSDKNRFDKNCDCFGWFGDAQFGSLNIMLTNYNILRQTLSPDIDIYVKILGFQIDDYFSLKYHIKEIINKTAKGTYALATLKYTQPKKNNHIVMNTQKEFLKAKKY